jgi:hypothetical protein
MDKKIDLKAVIQKSLDHYEKNKDHFHKERMDAAKSNPNCLSHWYPKIQSIKGINIPETKIIPFDYNDLLHSLDSNFTEGFKDSLKKVENAADEIGYPCFIKNSLFSAKHSWKDSCYIQNREQIKDHLRNITSDCYCVNAGDSLYVIVRKLIPTKAAFFAFSQMPVTKERRYFIKDGKVTFHHPYWIPKSIENASCEDWESKLNELNWESDEEILILTSLSEQVSKHIDGAWSVDWLQDKNGEWFLIDMALEQSSFKWSDYIRGSK